MLHVQVNQLDMHAGCDAWLQRRVWREALALATAALTSEETPADAPQQSGVQAAVGVKVRIAV